MKKRFMLFLAAMVLVTAGCSQFSNPIEGNAIIDWVDFVKLDGKMYKGLFPHVIKDPGLVTDQAVGEVRFRVAGVVSNPNYRTRNGDAAFLAEGTRLYRVEGFRPDEIIAAKDESVIGGYRLYAGEDFFKTIVRHYPDLPKDRVERIQLFEDGKVEPFRTLTGEEASRFVALLDSGEDRTDFRPDYANGDPDVYTMVFYTDGPVAHAYYLQDDGKSVFFHPWDTRVVDDEIRKYLEPQT